MNKNLKIRLYPTVSQMSVLENHFSGYRYCYNLCLEYKSTMWSGYKVSKSGYDMQSEIFEIRKDTPWLLKCKAECIRDAALNVDKSYKKFFKGKGFPKFKSKKGEQSFAAYQSLKVKNSKLHFYGQKIKFKSSVDYESTLTESKIKRVTFKRDLCGNYWAICLVDILHEPIIIDQHNSIGLDMGLKNLVVASDGCVFENIQFLKKSQNKLKRLQRKLCKTKKRGSNRKKLQYRIAKLYQKVTRQKDHYYHKITNQIISENQTIVVETLKIQNMIKNRKLSRSISSASWNILIQMLEYKSVWNNRELIKIDKWFPSSKKCSRCQGLKEVLLLSERTYHCEYCGLSIDRDINAAINIRNEGIKIPGLPVEVAC